jgi:hypothetical protein
MRLGREGRVKGKEDGIFSKKWKVKNRREEPCWNCPPNFHTTSQFRPSGMHGWFSSYMSTEPSEDQLDDKN